MLPDVIGGERRDEVDDFEVERLEESCGVRVWGRARECGVGVD